ncbi:MAG TPA: polymer-forming cytoskeletal protein [Thermoanaerobaculia bacterium]|jgi:cytoskeletal protein CcmA (bactofilin family)|nr:polymer-forming cytoskeletal protein [Thermoanaerobaculia bacterium]
MVWKKSDDPPAHHPEPTPTVPPRSAVPAPSPTPAAGPSSSHEPPKRMDRATIGASIFIKGDLSGEEDLVIEGRVEGKVDLKQNNVTVGKNGKVKADVWGRVVTIEGEVTGNVFAREQAILRQSGAINGNIQAPRVILEDGSRFKGSIDMEAPKETGSPSREREHRPELGHSEASRPEVAGVKASA